MKKKRLLIQLFLIAGLLFTAVTACDKSDDPGGDDSSSGTVKDADGNVYNTVKIGNQVWTVENLKTTKYNNGKPIPNVTDNDEWINLTTGAYCNYDNLESNADIYGRLYNWHAVNTGKLAPKGWHVPTWDDWKILRDYLITNGFNYDGTREDNKIAKSLCSKTNWDLSKDTSKPGCNPENNNSTGFTALPGGQRAYDHGTFFEMGSHGLWWSSSKFDDHDIYVMQLSNTMMSLEGYFDPMTMGFSVRLVKD